MNTKIYLSKGNKKLSPTKQVKYIIFNLPAQITCIYATEACKKACYAKKAERCYPSVLPCRMNNLEATKNKNFVANMIEAIEKMLATPSYSRAKHIIFRIHESGDFYSQKYIYDWHEIIHHFRSIKKLHFVAYTKATKCFRYANYWRDMENVTLLHSIWHDTDMDIKNEILSNNLKYYTACNSIEWDIKPEKQKCHCKNCSTCFKCFTDNKNYNKLFCEIH